jgi:hypothetical protein
MKKIKAILTACMMVGLATMTLMPSSIGSEESITVTLTPDATANITLDQSTWEPGCGIGETNQTADAWGTCTNDGDVRCNVSVNITEDAGTVWEILDTYSDTPGYNNVSFAIYNGSGWPVLNEAGTTFGTIAYGGSQTFGLNVTMAEYTSTDDDQLFTITFIATPYGS